MGHRVGKDYHRQLGRTLDGLTSRSPWSPTLRAILETLYTAEEAKVVATMPTGLSTVTRIAQVTGIAPAQLTPLLTGLARKGLLIDLHRDDIPYYTISPMVIGVFEFTMMRRGADLDHQKIARLFHRYLNEEPEFWTSNLATGNRFSILRTLPHEDSLGDQEHVEVLDFDKASHLVRRAKRFALGICSCRHEKHHQGRACDTPLELCSAFDLGADYLIRNDLARESSREEMLDLLQQSRDRGLVLSADNVQRGTQYICHCCGCCCNYLAGLNHWGHPQAVLSSSFLAKLDPSACTRCGRCIKKCPVSAIVLRDPPAPGRAPQATSSNNHPPAFPAIDPQRCIGCGVCVVHCSPRALHLIPRPQRIITPADSFEKVVLQALEKGTLQNLLFDNPNSTSQAFGRTLLRTFLRLDPVKRALFSDLLRSHFLNALRAGVKVAGMGWLMEDYRSASSPPEPGRDASPA